MAGAHRDVVLVEHGGEIVRVHAVDVEREDAEPPLPGADQPHARHARQPVDAVAGQRLLVLEDRVAAEPLDEIERRAEPDRAGDVGRAGLEAVRRLLERRSSRR